MSDGKADNQSRYDSKQDNSCVLRASYQRPRNDIRGQFAPTSSCK